MNKLTLSLAAVGLALSSVAAEAASARFASEIFVDEGDYSRTQAADGFPGNPQRYVPDNALGNDTSNWFSLGFGGTVALAFGSPPPKPFKDSALIIETTFRCDQGPGLCVDSQEEIADVYVLSADAAPFTMDGTTSFGTDNFDLSGFLGDTANADTTDSVFFLGSLPNAEAQNGAVFDLTAALAELGDLAFVLIADTTDQLLPGNGGTGTSSRDGFDVAAVQVQAIPLPMTAWMLIAGLSGMGLLGRKRAAA